MKKVKKWGLRILKIVAVFAFLYFVVALIAPSDYKVERLKEMTASPEAIFEQISDFEAWDEWSPWAEKDSTLKNTRTGEPGTVGHKTEWEGDPDISGKGSMTITEIKENEFLKYELYFADMDMTSTGAIELIDSIGVVTVKWSDQGDIPFMFRPMMLFMDMDEMRGPDFERGLIKLDSMVTIVQENSLQALLLQKAWMC